MVYSGLQTKSRPRGKSFSHPRLVHTPFRLCFLPCSPQMKSLYSGKQRALSLPSLGYKNQRAKWMFSSENWHCTEGRKCRLQFRHVLISGEGEEGGAKLAQESVGKSSILSLIPATKDSSCRVLPTLFIFLLKGFG